jgi:TetR/AcrR family transcriptional regulator, regulator of autoinduction and epiphytic fitness
LDKACQDILNPNSSPKRTYDSRRRKEQARQTRRQIIEAARKLFIARGYSGATMESIAEEAGVAVETVYASFGNKRGILSILIGVSLVGDDDPTPLLQREGPIAVIREKDQNRQIQLFSADMAEIMGRVAPLFEVMRAAAKTEPDIAEMLHRLLVERAEAMKFFIRGLMSNGPLLDGLTLEAAADTVWVVTSGEVYTLLVTDRGWSVDQYKQWLANALTKLIVPLNND